MADFLSSSGQPQSAPQAQPEPQPQSAPQAQPEPQPQPVSQAQPEPQPQPVSQAQPEPQSQPAFPSHEPPQPGRPYPAQPQSAPQTQAVPQGVQPQRQYVHHSYIWLGTLRSAGAAILVLIFSFFTSIAGLLFDDASGSKEALFVGGISIAAVVVVLFLASFLYQWWSYKHLWYEVGDEELSVYSGIFNKKRIHVPYQRVQSVDQHASLLQRVFGVCTVDVDTAGGSSHTAVKIPYVRKDQAERLRMELYRRKRLVLGLGSDSAAAPVPHTSSGFVPVGQPFAPAAAPGQWPAPQPGAQPAAPQLGMSPAAAQPAPGQEGNVLDFGAEIWNDVRGVFAGDAVDMGRSSYEHRLSNKELVFTGLSNSTGFVIAIIGVLATVFQIVGSLGSAASPSSVESLVAHVGSNVLGESMFAVTIAVALAVLVVMWVMSVVGSCLMYGGFVARRRGKRIEVEHGLLQHRLQGVDVDRVQSVIVKQSVIRRLLGYCELSLGKIDATGTSSGEQQQTAVQTGIVIHPFVKRDRVPEILAGLIPEFADVPTVGTPLPRVALRRALIRRGILQGAGFWIAVVAALSQILLNALFHPQSAPEATLLFYFNAAFCALYAVCAIVFVFELIAAVLWARNSSFAYNRRFMQVTNAGLGCETVSFPRRKIQFGYTRSNPFQRRARTATIAVRTAAGTGGTTVQLIDVCEKDAEAWLEWLRPRTNAVS